MAHHQHRKGTQGPQYYPVVLFILMVRCRISILDPQQTGVNVEPELSHFRRREQRHLPFTRFILATLLEGLK